MNCSNVCQEELTHSTLSGHLKNLERKELARRVEYLQTPPKVEYQFSEIGNELRKVLSVLEIWGNKYISYLNRIDKTSK